MNEELLKNILLYQENTEPLNKELFNTFLNSMKNFYDFVSKGDIFLEKLETIEKIKADKNHLETLTNIKALNHLKVNRDTKYKLLKHILEDSTTPSNKILYTMNFIVYLIRGQKVKFLKQQQMELIDIVKNDRDMQNKNAGFSIIQLCLGLDVIKHKYFLDNKTIGYFDLYHNLNKAKEFSFNDMNQSDFINYLVKQFSTYRLIKPMTLTKTEVSLQQAVFTFFDQNISVEKKEILVTFLDMIRDKLSLDRENDQFLDKLVLNTKLNQKSLNQEQPTQKEKKIKI